MIYVTTDTERLDLVCWRHYGTLAGSVEAVLAAPLNAALRHLDISRLPAGTRIDMPPKPEVALPPRVF